MTRTAVVLGVVLLGACTSDLAVVERFGFESSTVTMCDPATSEVGLVTRDGGILIFEVVDGCGRVVSRCEAPDLYAPGARASIRTAGTDVLVEGCAADASSGVTLRAGFAAPDASESTETYEVSLRGDCLTGSPGSCVDAAIAPADAGPPDAAASDAAGVDAGA